VLAATVSKGDRRNMIVSSFESKPVSFPISVSGSASRLHTDTLTTTTAIEAGGSVAVHAHRARLTLAPNTVVAIQVG
jgi:hypothetical protein